MRQKVTVIVILGIILTCSYVVKSMYFHNVEGDIAFYFLSLIWICAILIPFLIFNLAISIQRQNKSNQIKTALHNSNSYKEAHPLFGPSNRRQTYRITYPVSMRPTFVVDIADGQSKRNLEFQVLDLSEKGICFIDDGSLGQVEQLSGRLYLKNGAKPRVVGKLVRHHKGRSSVHLGNRLDGQTILQEQRLVRSRNGTLRN